MKKVGINPIPRLVNRNRKEKIQVVCGVLLQSLFSVPAFFVPFPHNHDMVTNQQERNRKKVGLSHSFPFLSVHVQTRGKMSCQLKNEMELNTYRSSVTAVRFKTDATAESISTYD